jgi:putative salt-induced outer membrane protein
MRFVLPVVLLFLMSVSLARADSVLLNNGDRVSGTIEELNPASVIITTRYAGRLVIDRSAIKTLQSDKPVTIIRPNDQKEQLFLSPTADGKSWKETTAYAPPPPPATAPVAATAPAAMPPPTKFLSISPLWKNQIALGMTNTSGNGHSTQFSGNILFHYVNKPDELTLKFEGAYGNTNDQLNAAYVDENAVYRHDLNEKWYLYTSDDVRHDALKGVSLQATGAGGLGYWISRTDKFKFDLRGGPGVTYLKTFDGNENISPAIDSGTRLEYAFNERLSVAETATYTSSLTDFAIWHLNSETALQVKLDIDHGLGIKLSFVDDYENRPSAGHVNNDTRFVLSLTYDF